MSLERRVDCEEFEMKQNEYSLGQCQTDGHYLCSNCIHIASFRDMELSDNWESYYPKDEKIKRMTELLKVINDYLDDNHTQGSKSAIAINTISTKSTFHQEIKAELAR